MTTPDTGTGTAEPPEVTTEQECAENEEAAEPRHALYGTRAEHLAFCKERALEYADRGDLTNAMASMGSDLNKHPETAGHSAMPLMMMLAANGHLDQPSELRKFIEGFN